MFYNLKFWLSCARDFGYETRVWSHPETTKVTGGVAPQILAPKVQYQTLHQLPPDLRWLNQHQPTLLLGQKITIGQISLVLPVVLVTLQGTRGLSGTWGGWVALGGLVGSHSVSLEISASLQ